MFIFSIVFSNTLIFLSLHFFAINFEGSKANKLACGHFFFNSKRNAPNPAPISNTFFLLYFLKLLEKKSTLGFTILFVLALSLGKKNLLNQYLEDFESV